MCCVQNNNLKKKGIKNVDNGRDPRKVVWLVFSELGEELTSIGDIVRAGVVLLFEGGKSIYYPSKPLASLII